MSELDDIMKRWEKFLTRFHPAIRIELLRELGHAYEAGLDKGMDSAKDVIAATFKQIRKERS